MIETNKCQLPSRPLGADFRFRFKLAVGFFLVAALFAYLCFMYGIGGIRFAGNELQFRAADYIWIFRPVGLAVAKVLGAIIVFVLIIRPQFGRPLARRFNGIGVPAVVFLLWIPCAYEIWVVGTDWLMRLLVITGTAIAAYVSWRVVMCTRVIARISLWAAHNLRDFRAPITISLSAAAILTLGSWAIYRFQPLIVDAQSQVAQARILLSGKWALPISTAVRNVIYFPNSVPTGPTYSYYPPGHIVLLIPIIALNWAPAVLSIICGALQVTVVYKLGKLINGRRTGILAAMLLAASEWFYVINSSAMNHTTTSLELTTATYCLLKALHAAHAKNCKYYMAFAGFCLAFAVTTRPLTGVTHLALWAAIWLIAVVQQRKAAGNIGLTFQRFLFAPLYCFLGTIPPLVGFMYYNVHTTGKPWLLQYTVGDPEFHQLGFINTPRFVLTPSLAIHHHFSNFMSLNEILFGWPIGSLFLLVAWFVRSRLRPAELILAMLCVAQSTAYFFYHFFHLFIGPRFWYETLPFLAVLSAIPLSRASYVIPSILRTMATLTFVVYTLTHLVLEPSKYPQLAPQYKLQFIRWVERQLPFEQPTVIIVPETDTNVVGQLIEPGTAKRPMLLFVEEKDEVKARAIAELRDYKWIKLDERALAR